MGSVYKTWKKKCKGFFEPEELLSLDGMKLLAKGHMVMNWEFLAKLVAFREKMDTPFYVNHAGMHRRGWRSCRENVPLGGRPYHPMGVAADVTAKGMDTLELAAEAQFFGFHGVGIYGTFVHIDLRPRFGDRLFTWDKR